MELEILKKKISTYRGDGGRVKITDDTLMMEILHCWEQWTAPADGFYKSIGVSQKGMASIIGRAKKLRREGFSSSGFKEIRIADGANLNAGALGPCSGIEMCLDGGKLIRFQQVDQLIEFLKKAA
jgi:hypothetical protein